MPWWIWVAESLMSWIGAGGVWAPPQLSVVSLLLLCPPRRLSHESWDAKFGVV